jgi:hypothetical protein
MQHTPSQIHRTLTHHATVVAGSTSLVVEHTGLRHACRINTSSTCCCCCCIRLRLRAARVLLLRLAAVMAAVAHTA